MRKHTLVRRSFEEYIRICSEAHDRTVYPFDPKIKGPFNPLNLPNRNPRIVSDLLWNQIIRYHLQTINYN
jgi:hypothetical protein